MLISKMQPYLCDKMPPKKVKIKKRKKMGLQFKILDFLIPFMTYFKKKNFHLSEEPILKFINTKIEKR
jgi:hypothetical protein